MNQPVQQNISQPFEQPNIWQYLAIIYRHLWVVILVFISVLSLTLYRNYKAIPIYEAESTVLLEASSPNLFNSQFTTSYYTMYLSQRYLLQNQMLFLRSYQMAQLVAKEFGKNELAIALKPYKGMNLTEEERLKILSIMVKSSLVVSQDPQSDFLHITIRFTDPKIATFIANTYAEVFQREDLSYKRSTMKAMKEFVAEQLNFTKKQLDDAEDQLKAYKMSNNVVYLDAEGQRIISNIGDLEKMYFDANSQYQGVIKQIGYYESEIRKEKLGFVPKLENISSPMITQLRNKMVELEMAKTGLEEKGYKDNHPKLKEINLRIGKTSRQLVDALEEVLTKEHFTDPQSTLSEYIKTLIPLEVQRSGLDARKKVLKNAVNNYNSKLLGFPQKEINLARLVRDRAIAEKIYIMLKEQYQTIRITEAGELSRVRIIDFAKEPTAPILPQKRRDLFIGIIMGLVLGFVMSFFLEYLDDRIRSPEELQRFTGLSILGVIPLISSDRKVQRGSKHELSSIEERLVTHYDPKSPTAEAYRSLRTSIMFSRAGKTIKTILITSSGPREGKSTTAANLAITMSQMGSKTLLIDSDLRRPILHSLFGMNKEPGLTNHILGGIPLEESARKTSIDNLFVMPAGTMPPNPSEILSSQIIDDFIDKSTKYFDVLVFDSPPIIAVTDPIVLGLKVDGVCLVVDGYSVKRAIVKRAIDNIMKMNLPILGAIFNKLDFQKRYGYYGYYNYYYYYYSGEGKRSQSKRKRTKS
ncbi:MAG: polysaccharide biosynthesis tyrosine autokinase [Candidatus Coatesbacteria bacterium]|nr:polysaccharide biosynthesis tyrosine autokinase [Candidatus Coatesbacteria bacterium]